MQFPSFISFLYFFFNILTPELEEGMTVGAMQ